jgi:hypothetical protein
MNGPSRQIRLSALKDRKVSFSARDVDRSELFQRISNGNVIPIIGNSVQFEQIFGSPPADGENDAGSASVNEQLAEIWAQNIGYPLADTFDLARVALYNRVISDDGEHAKRRYLSFLKTALLDMFGQDPQAAGLVEELRTRINALSFADIVQELGAVIYPTPQEDPLRMLASLNLPIYVTTSYFDFMERAIIAQGRTPRTQVCFWSGKESNVAPEHVPDPNFVPSRDQPLVYHLFGLEKYPSTMVLSEDDYLAFLVEVARNPVIPTYLSGELSSKSLILFGYNLHDWDFRVVFRGVVKPGLTVLRSFGLILQINPDRGGMGKQEDAQNYLKEYFQEADFKVEWGVVEQYIQNLWKEWSQWSRGQA